SELQCGRKRGHWMWYIFPQMLGLGQSFTSQTFGISCMAEARAYASHAILGPRLLDCTRLVLDIEGRLIENIFSYPDHMKFFSSMTLFAQLDPPQNVAFVRALSKFFSERRDQATIRLLREAESTR